MTRFGFCRSLERQLFHCTTMYRPYSRSAHLPAAFESVMTYRTQAPMGLSPWRVALMQLESSRTTKPRAKQVCCRLRPLRTRVWLQKFSNSQATGNARTWERGRDVSGLTAQTYTRQT